MHLFYSQMLSADFRGAQRSIDEALKLWPENARYHVWRGYCLSQSLPQQCFRKVELLAPVIRTINDAAAEYRAALKLNDRDAVAHHDLAWLEHLAGNHSIARAEWERATQIDPDNAVFHLSLGMFLEESGVAANAADHFTAAVQLSPAALDSPLFARHPDLAKVIIQRCITETETRLARGNDPILKARLGKFYLYMQDLARASQMLRDAALDLPNLPLVWLNLGEVYRLQGNHEEALACYKRARLLDDGLPGPHLGIGQLDEQSGHAVLELRLAAQWWARMNPVTAVHNNRLYHGILQQIDDLLPTTLVWYVSPCGASMAYSLLAKIYPHNKNYVQRSHACEEIPDPHRF